MKKIMAALSSLPPTFALVVDAPVAEAPPPAAYSMAFVIVLFIVVLIAIAYKKKD